MTLPSQTILYNSGGAALENHEKIPFWHPYKYYVFKPETTQKYRKDKIKLKVVMH